MPKKVDHDERRREIAHAVAHLAATRGLREVSFREVADEANMSVALVQHYYGTKDNMLVGALNLISSAMGKRIEQRLADLGEDTSPLDCLREVAVAFIPVDEETREAMLAYHGFAAAALTDPGLRSVEAFSQGRVLVDFFANQIALERERIGQAATADDGREALALLSLLLGLSLSVLLDEVDVPAAIDALDHYIRNLS